jgi:DNA invertase Pin-like site-specific DNA recombinase
MGRLTLNVLLSFAQFEREVTSERIRDKSLESQLSLHLIRDFIDRFID